MNPKKCLLLMGLFLGVFETAWASQEREKLAPFSTEAVQACLDTLSEDPKNLGDLLQKIGLPVVQDGKPLEIPIFGRGTLPSSVDQQIDSIRMFVLDLFLDLLGEGHELPFNRVIVRRGNRGIELEGRALVVQVSRIWSYLSDQQLRSQWTAGDMFHSESALKPRWRILNPVSDLRLWIGDTVKVAGNKMARTLEGVIAKHRDAVDQDPEDENVKRELYLDFLPLLHFHVSESKLKDADVKQIAQLQAGDLMALVEHWKAACEDPLVRKLIVDQASGQVREVRSQLDSEKDVVVTGFVALSNEKDISVNLSSISEADHRYVEVVMEKRKRKIRVHGWVYGSYFEDFVDVNVVIYRGLETASLDQAFRRLMQNRPLPE